MFPPFSFIFYKGSSLVSKIIKKFTDSEYSHLAFMLDQLHILQLDWKTPVSIQHFNYKNKSYDVYLLNIELTDKQKQIILNFIKRNLNSEYDWKYFISRGLNILFGTRIVNSKNRYNCDELIVEAFRQAGIELVDETVILSPETLSKSKYLTKIV